MPNNTLISIITPSYFSEKYIDDCIKSVLSQTYENWEMLIVDGNSKDATLQIIEKYSLLDLDLVTGRNHQIRAHLKHIGHPLFNDLEYGGDKVLKGTSFTKYKQFVENCFRLFPGQALHAKSLGFHHPTLNKEVNFEKMYNEKFNLNNFF